MPLPIISIEQMREWEQATWATGQTEGEVIRRVGQALGRKAMSMTSPDGRVLILAGKGNNGADARCAKEHLTERRVDLLDVGNVAKDVPRLEGLLSLTPDLVIDGLFGIGINRALSPDWIRFIETLNQAQRPVLAVDVPSGLDANTGEPYGAAVRASVTLTVGAPKLGLILQPAWPYVGRLEVSGDVGLARFPIAAEMQWTSEGDFKDYPPPRPSFTHKGTYGHLGILAGSLGYHGAAVLASRGAQRAQPGLVTLHTQDPVYCSVAAQLQAVMVTTWRGNRDLSGDYEALVAGPGLASEDLPAEVKQMVRRIWRQSARPVIIDASALAWLEQGPVKDDTVRVITPHPGEAARLLQCRVAEIQADRTAALRELSRRFGNTWVVLKGQQTLVGRAAREVFVNSSGNPHLAQGGSGDVLAGYIGGLLAQPELQRDPLKALRYAVWQHGAAADSLQKSRPSWVVEDLVEALGTAAVTAP